MNNRLINTKVAGGGGGCTDIVDNYDPFGGNGVALYQLNGDATDESENYNGTDSNVTWGGVGVFGTSAAFNGSSSSIDTNYSLPASSDSTVSMWFKTSNTATKFLLTQSAGSPYTSSMHIAIVSSGTGLELQVGASYNEFSVGSIANNSWHNLVLVRNAASGYTIYLDGSSKGTWANTTALEAADLFLGTRFDNTSLTFDGSIDQVRIFNTALTPLEVEALYTEELCICDGTVDTLDILGDGSCIATYQLDGNANDLSGNYSGTPTNVSYGVGEFDLAGVFNGSNSQILVSSVSGFPSGNSARTLSFWMNSSSYLNGGVLGYGAGANNQGFLFYIENSTLTVTFYLNDASVNYSLSTNQWYNIVATHDGSTFTVYVNGSSVSSAAKTLNTSATNFKIGGAPWNSSGEYFSGSIDQVRIFNKALSAGEVTTLYNETACTYEETVPIIYLDAGDKRSYSGSGNTWYDISGVGNNATLQNPTQPTFDSLHFDFADLGAQNKYGGNNVSIEFFIRTNNLDDDYFLTGYNGGGFLPGEMVLYIPSSVASGKPYLRVTGSTSSSSQLAFNHTVVQSDWTHYVLVYDSTITGNTNRFIMYVNGSAVTTSVVGGVDGFDNANFMGDSSTLFIGKRGGGTDYEEMDIKLFRIYQQSLTAAQVLENYNNL